ncbi:MAG: DUF86 domain-containing protein [Acidobacteria bacterium]|nr:MAG: DUF86 domain-containing protein [Acidobacteriota bacterium]
MTDPELVAKKLARVETSVRELQTLARPEKIESDIREQRFVEHTLQIAIQASLDAASHVISDDRLGEPSTYRELFDLLEKAEYIPSELARELEKMAGFRNVLVHGYDDVDLAIVRDIVENHLSDLLKFVECVRDRLP